MYSISLTYLSIFFHFSYSILNNMKTNELTFHPFVEVLFMFKILQLFAFSKFYTMSFSCFMISTNSAMRFKCLPKDESIFSSSAILRLAQIYSYLIDIKIIVALIF